MVNNPLTPHLTKVATLLAAGKTPRQIAEQLYLELTSVHTYRRNIYKQLGIHSRAELVAWAATAGLAQPGGADGR